MEPFVATPRHQLAGRALLALFVVAVVGSGLAWPLDHGGLALWPFNRGWWMFHREDGRYYHLRFAVMLPDGSRDEADIDRWFTYPASESTRRYDEVSRDPATLRALVRYLCARHNRDAPPARRWVAVTVTDTSWPQTRGRRVPLAATPWPDQRVVEHLHDEPCAP